MRVWLESTKQLAPEAPGSTGFGSWTDSSGRWDAGAEGAPDGGKHVALSQPYAFIGNNVSMQVSELVVECDTLAPMDAERLRALQAPLKARYKDDPASAMVTLRARGRVSQQSVTCALETGKAGLPAGLHPASGGDGTAACSGDMLLEALVGCAGVTLAAVATAMGIALKSAVVSAEGDLDFRGTLGVAKDAPVGFVRIRLEFSLDTDAPDDKVKKLVELSERYCVVYQTLVKSTPIDVSIGAP